MRRELSFIGTYTMTVKSLLVLEVAFLILLTKVLKISNQCSSIFSFILISIKQKNKREAKK